MLTRRPTARQGKILVLFALLLIALLGMVGLLMDGGLMMSLHRRTHNAADSAALAAATDLMRGGTTTSATTAATTFVTTHNGLSNATVTVNVPPSAGPHAGNVRYAEVTVSVPTTTVFAHVLGGSQSQTVTARAVAGYEPVSSGEGAIVLDPYARPGLSIDGSATLLVNGAVVVNSSMAGVDQYGAAVNWGGAFSQTYALTASNNATVKARYIQVRGGVDVPANYEPFEMGDPSPLFCRATIGPDPLRELPTPTSANVSSITNWTRQAAITVPNNTTRTFTPGVYADIQINQGATVIFQPGVYIFSPINNNQGLRINGNCTVTGNGVMFYMTGSNYLDVSPGYRDAADNAQAALDGPLPPTNASTIPASTDPNANQVRFATMDCNATGATVTLTGLADSSSPFNGILFYQRRRNNTSPRIQGNAGMNVNLGGTIYAKWGRFTVSGGGAYNAQFVVGSLSLSGTGTITINANGKSFGRANQVFLVE